MWMDVTPSGITARWYGKNGLWFSEEHEKGVAGVLYNAIIAVVSSVQSAEEGYHGMNSASFSGSVNSNRQTPNIKAQRGKAPSMN